MWSESDHGSEGVDGEDGASKGEGQISLSAERLEYPYYWRVKTRYPERKGQPCRVLVWGKKNNALVEFEDGHMIITSRNYIRKRKKE